MIEPHLMVQYVETTYKAYASWAKDKFVRLCIRVKHVRNMTLD